MKHVRTSHPHYSLNCTFSLGVLMLSTDTREILGLFFGTTIRLKFFCIEDTIITMVAFDSNSSFFPQEIFNTLLCCKCITYTQRDLIFHPDEATSRISEDGTTMITIVGTFLTISRLKSSRGLADILVHMDTISRSNVIRRQDTFLFFNSFGSFGLGSTLLLTSKLTGFANRNSTGGGVRKFRMNNLRQNISTRIIIIIFHNALPHERLYTFHTNTKFPVP